MCHAFVSDSRFYQFSFRMDQEIANEVQQNGCAHCGATLHVACYPRKPRGCALDESCKIRLSFCCASDGCRRRCTPPSVRFLGRKVYLGAMVVLVMAMQHGLSAKRRQQPSAKIQILADDRRLPRVWQPFSRIFSDNCILNVSSCREQSFKLLENPCR